MEFRDIVSYSGAEFENQTSLPLPMTFMISQEAQWDADVCSHQPIIMNDDYFLNPCSFPDYSSINFMRSSMMSPPPPLPPSCSVDDDDEVDKTSENCVKRKPMDDEDSQKQQKSSKKMQRQELQQEEKETEEKEKQQSKRISRRGCATDAQSVYARKRRERITERLKTLQKLVPNGTKVDISTMLEQAIHYVKFMQLQIKLLSSDQHWMYTPIAFNGSFPNMDLDIL